MRVLWSAVRFHYQKPRLEMKGFHITAASFVAIILAANLSGCGGSGGPKEHGKSTNQASSNSTGPTTEAPSGMVPPVDGVAVDVAELYLKKAGLTLGRQIQQTNSKVEDGLVITSQPPVGQKEALGTAVELIISKGSAGCQPPGPSWDHLNIIGKMKNVVGDFLPQAITSLALSDRKSTRLNSSHLGI